MNSSNHLPPGSRVAIVGTGIAGLTAARHLHDAYDLTLFEAGDHVGGHTNTIDVHWQGRDYAVDTGFIVFNNRTYPNFVRMLDEIGVASQQSDMSFGVRCDRTGLEYCGSSLGQIFAQRRNVLRPSFLWMLREILRFNREAPRLLETPDDGVTLGVYLERGHYSRRFVDNYIVPMGAAIWSASPAAMRQIPARFFVRFFANHGMLTVKDRPTWRVVRGGSREYVRRLTAPFADRIRVSTPIEAIHRTRAGVCLQPQGGPVEVFDGVVLATHSDTALRLLAEPTGDERELLGAIPYQPNEAILHVDERVLPRRAGARAAWNYRIPTVASDRVAVTYDMNTLQGLDAPVRFLVTLNSDADIDPDKIIRRIRYQHPVFTTEGIAAQRRHAEISGRHRTWFCGAYWGYGFHEDGVKSGLAVVEQLRAARLVAAS